MRMYNQPVTSMKMFRLTEVSSVVAVMVRCSVFVGGIAEWVECWSRPANFPCPAPD